MSIFDHQRLTNSTFKLDIERMRQGWYTDKYFVNVAVMLSALSKEGYTLAGKFSGIPVHLKEAKIYPGDLEVEMQWFTRRMGKTIVVGADTRIADRTVFPRPTLTGLLPNLTDWVSTCQQTPH